MRDSYSASRGRRWDGVLRCADCGEQIIFTKLSQRGKEMLDQIVRVALDQMQGQREKYDQEAIDRQLAFHRYLEENHRA